MAGEVTVVVFSILLAFGIEAGWDSRGERAAELNALDALLDEMTENRGQLAWVIATNDSAATRVSAWLRADSGQLAHLLADSAVVFGLPALHVSIWAPYTYDPRVGALGVFLDRADSPIARKAGAFVRT